MRELTLHEKITFKGVLRGSKQLQGRDWDNRLARLDTQAVLYLMPIVRGPRWHKIIYH